MFLSFCLSAFFLVFWFRSLSRIKKQLSLPLSSSLLQRLFVMNVELLAPVIEEGDGKGPARYF